MNNLVIYMFLVTILSTCYASEQVSVHETDSKKVV
jgi:hypothetical protein